MGSAALKSQKVAPKLNALERQVVDSVLRAQGAREAEIEAFRFKVREEDEREDGPERDDEVTE